MEAIRKTVNVVGNTITLQIPDSFTARRVEVIVLPAHEQTPTPAASKRTPSPGLAGTVIHDDLIAPAVDARDWTTQK